MRFFIEALIGCIIILIGYWYISDIIFEKKTKKSLISYIWIILTSILLTTLNVLRDGSMDKIIKIIAGFVLMIFFNKYQYKRKMTDIILGTFIVYVNLYLSEVLVVVLFSILSKLIGIDLLIVFKFSLLANIITVISSLLIMNLLKRVYLKLFKNILYYDLNLLCSVVVVLIVLTILLTRTPIEEWRLNVDFVTTMSLITMFCFIGIYMIKQKSDIDKVSDEYTKLAEYSQNNEGLLEEYRVNLHESKNQLIIIDNMIPKKYKEVHEYIDGLIEKSKSGKYYWLTELKYVPLQELKGFMNFKIMEMINQKLNLEINVSREINKSIFKNYKLKDKEDLYSIIGVFLDNAREAAKLSKEKAVSIQMYMENKDIKLIIANTYKGKVELEKIYEYGYSSKGINRGTGLHIVDGIVNGSPLFEKETTIMDNYFVQTLTIKPKQKKKKS